ncbi:transposase [Microcoleus sp. N9_B4]|uniref:transposase n=1 Tax=Microcoleus sp. N9_B4 TaxID=3055386 RepID=UPI002FCEFA8A
MTENAPARGRAAVETRSATNKQLNWEWTPGRYPSLRQMEKGCRQIYRQRNIVERAINRLKQWSRIAIRYEKLTANYTAMIAIACILLWL